MFMALILRFLLIISVVSLLSSDVHGWRRRRRRRCSPKACVLSQWGGWTVCSASCGNTGSQARTRSITRDASCGGSCGGSTSETRQCNIKCCPVNCDWYWGTWDSCSGCGNTTQSRSVVISIVATCGGTDCPTSRRETRDCNTGRYDPLLLTILTNCHGLAKSLVVTR